MISNEEKKLKKYLSDLSKERLIDLYLQKDFADKIELGIMKIQISDLEAKLTLHEQSNKVLNDQLNKATEHIGELNDKLAESEKARKEAYQEGFLQKQFDKDMEIMQLKQQLAEKGQELNDICQNYDFQINDFSREIHRLKQREKVLDQDKISFALEQISYFKVLRGLILNMRMSGFKDWRNKIPMKYLAMTDAHIEKLADIIDDQVDNQIKQLKEMK